MSTIHLLCDRSLYCDWKVKESPKLKGYDTTTDDYGQPLPNIPAKFTIHYEHIETHYEDKPLDAADYEITIGNTQ